MSESVFILGAGCSRNYQGRSAIEGLVAPLQTDFFGNAAVYLRGIAESEANPLLSVYNIDAVLTRLAHFFVPQCRPEPEGFTNAARVRENLDRTLDTLIEAKVTLEDALSVVDTWTRNQKAIPSAAFDPRDLDRLIELLCEVLAAALGGEHCELHASLAGVVRPGDTVISFNYDTLIDEALLRTSRLSISGYSVPFSKHLCSEISDKLLVSRQTSQTVAEPSGEAGSVDLLKLHGSVNWLRCTACPHLYLDRGIPGLGFMAYLWRRRELMWGLKTILAFTRCGVCKADTKRIIMPPVSLKHYSDPVFVLLWRKAREAIVNARRLVVIGYSLPLTDITARLLLEWHEEPWSQKSVVIVDPDEGVRRRLTNIIGRGVADEFESLRTFIDASDTDKVEATEH